MNIPPSIRRKSRKIHSFSLVELMTVMAIASILGLLSVIAYSQIVRAQSLTASVQILSGAIDMARQSAITRNATVEFRIYELPDYSAATTATPTVYRAFQTFLIDANSTNALTQMAFLPSPVIISPTGQISSLMTNGTPVPPAPLPSIPTYLQNYTPVVFDFSPSGGLQLNYACQWYLTLMLENDTTSGSPALPKDYASIQLDPFTGKGKTFRP